MKLLFCPECAKPLTQQNRTVYVCPDGHTSYNNPVTGADIFVVENGKVLVGVRSVEPERGKIDAIGGFLDFGETLEEGARREFKEETGADIELLGIITSHHHLYTDDTSVVGVSFAARIISGEPNAADDVGELKWLAFDEIREEDLAFDWLKETLPEVEKWHQKHKP